MSNYTKEDKCVGCGAHISEYHNTPCVYDPDFEPNWNWCDECESYHEPDFKEQEDASLPYCGDCLVPLHDCAHADIYKGERANK